MLTFIALVEFNGLKFNKKMIDQPETIQLVHEFPLKLILLSMQQLMADFNILFMHAHIKNH